MTLLAMYDELEARLQPYDTDRDWTPVQLVTMLNRAQRIAVGKLHPFTTPSLITSTASLVITSGYYTLTDLTPDPFRGEAGIIDVKLSSGYYCTLISEEERQANEESSFVYQSTDPKMWYEGTKLYIRPYSGYTLTIRFRGEPTVMALKSRLGYDADGTPSTTKFVGDSGQDLSATDDTYNDAVVYSYQLGTYHVVTAYTGATRLFTVSPALSVAFADSNYFEFPLNDFDVGSNVNSALTDDVQDIILEIAEARALRAIDKRGSMLTMATAEDMIRELNSAYAPIQAVRLEVTDLIYRNY